MILKIVHIRRKIYVIPSPPRRLLCLLLTLVLMVTVLPVGALANDARADLVMTEADFESMKNYFNSIYNSDDFDDFVKGAQELYPTHKDIMDYYTDRFLSSGFASNDPISLKALDWISDFFAKAYGIDLSPEEAMELVKNGSAAHIHAWSPTSNRTHHFYRCTSGCGARKAERLHNRDGVNGSCTCGHTYLSNCGLTTLHFYDMTLSPAFDPEITEYTATPVSYRPNLEKTRITAFKFDALSTVALPADLTVTPGKVFEITVTAEDQVTAKTYTVTVAE